MRLSESDLPIFIGQIRVMTTPGGPAELRHHADADLPAAELTLYTDPEAAAALALYDDAGAYRPLKTAPNLCRGWRMLLPDERALRLALDLFYPGRLGACAAFRAGTLRATSLRETLGRQTGMYRVTQKLTDEQADALVTRFCRTDGGCLRTILWRRDAAGTLPSARLPPEKFAPPADDPRSVPLLCQEACNLLVAEARAVVKAG